MIKSALNSYATSLNKIWEHDRSQTVGASEIGQCMRKTYWVKNEGDPMYGAPRDPDYIDGWGARMRGTIYENEFWAPAMQATYGSHLLFAGKEQKTLINRFLSATPDGLLVDLPSDALAGLGVPDIGGNCITVEAKTADPRTNLSNPKPENVFQTQVQMGLIRQLTPYQPNYSLLSYTDASFWNEVLEFPIAFDPAIYRVAEARAATIMTATNAADLKPEGWIAGGAECEYCPFTKACGVTRRSVPTQDMIPDAQFVAEIADMASAAKHLEDAIEVQEAKLREAQQAIKDRLREKSIRKIPGVISWSAVKGRQSYDNKAIKEAAIAAGVDISQFETTGEPTDRLQITLKNSGSPESDKAQASARTVA